MSSTKSENEITVEIKVNIKGKEYIIETTGNGRLDAISNALKKTDYTFDYDFVTYSEHAISSNSNSKAAAYVCIADSDGEKFWGVGTHPDIILASVNALVSAFNRQNRKTHFVK